jgi:hypothetical protein
MWAKKAALVIRMLTAGVYVSFPILGCSQIQYTTHLRQKSQENNEHRGRSWIGTMRVGAHQAAEMA